MNNKNHVELPVHFFTIVLNGKPFIKYHINVFKQLPFKWRWHIIEGVADLINDTAWSLQNGARISDELHNNGLSNDGTSEYLDKLQNEFPDNVTVYRKGGGKFWNGKLEMVNAPLKNINSECILWEIDSDELWTAEQFSNGRQLYLNNPDKTASYYFCYFFVGENKFITSVNTYGNHTDFEWLRSWRFKPGDQWISHEPPTLCRLNENGEWINIGRINPFTHSVTQHHKLVFQHYAYVTPEQLKFKEQYYGYKNALTQWEQLQKQSNFPLLLKHYFEWVKDETIVDDSRKYGIIPLAQINGRNWEFNFPPEENKSVTKILFVRTDSIGDCIIAASMLEPIKNKYKDAQVDVVCQDKTSIVFKNSPFVNKVIDYNRVRIKNDKLYKDSILSVLRKENYDIVLNTVFSREDVTDIISLGSGAKKIIGLNGDSCNISREQLLINNQFYNILINLPPGLTELQNHKMFLNELGIDDGDLNPVIWHDEYSENFAEGFFQKNNLKKENTIAFFPFAQHIHKEYPGYEEIIKHYPQFTFLILGGDEKINDDKLKLWASFKNCINLVGKTSILQMSSLIKRCGLYIGADSAGVHIACANNIKNVVILGGGHFGRFLPYSKFTSAVAEPMDCYSCNWNCKYSRVKCVWDIDYDLIIYAIDKTIFEIFDKPSIFFKYENDEQHSIIKKYFDAEKVNVFEYPQRNNNNTIIKEEKMFINEIENAIETGNYTEAIQLLQEVINNNPSDTEALNNLAVVLSILGEKDSAVRALNLVLQVDPQNEVALDNLKALAV